MLIYLEKRVEEYPIAQNVLKFYSNAQVLRIDHYKNIFDKKIERQHLTQALIIAKEEHPNLLDVPKNYGYP
ncbi:hypothetical protein IJU97_02865 [bacterium]|nr:hypothetical protein [bacterium]